MEILNHHHLYLFWKLCQFESFSKTATHLKISQSAVTIQIQKLEESTQRILIDRRERKKFKLTPDGQKVYRYADEIFHLSLQLQNWLKHEKMIEKRRIKIGAAVGISRNLIYHFLEPLIEQGPPDAQIELSTGEYFSLIRELESNRLDIVLSSSYFKPKNPDSLQSKVLLSSPLVMVTSNPKAKSIDALHMILPGFAFDSRIEFDEWARQQQMELKCRAEIDDIAMLRVFAIRSPQCAVVVPEVGVTTDIETKKLKVIKRIDSIKQKFYAIIRNDSKSQTLSSSLIERLTTEKSKKR